MKILSNSNMVIVLGDHSFTDEGLFLAESGGNLTNINFQEKCSIFKCTKPKYDRDLFWSSKALKYEDWGADETKNIGVLCYGKQSTGPCV